MKSNTSDQFLATFVVNKDVSSIVDEQIGTTSFVVANSPSNVRGNRKDPNPIFFSRDRYGFRKGSTYSRSVDFDYQVKVTSRSGSLGVEFVQHLASTDPYPDTGRLTDDAMTKLYDQISGNSNLAVDLAESAATLKMLKSTLSLRGLMKEFYRGIIKQRGYKRTQGQARLDYVTKKWLEYRYGWMPLVYSIQDAFDTLTGDHLLNQPLPVKARKSLVKVDTIVYGDGTFANPTTTHVSYSSHRIEICANFRPRGASIFDFTTLNAYAIAWELLPLSFVADWVWNVSQFIDLMEKFYLWNPYFRSGYLTQTIKRHSVVHRSGSSPSTIQYYPDGTPVPYTGGGEFYQSSSFLNTVSKQRSILTSLPTPNGIRMKVSFGAKRQLDAAALLLAFSNRKGLKGYARGNPY